MAKISVYQQEHYDKYKTQKKETKDAVKGAKERTWEECGLQMERNSKECFQRP